MALLTFSALCVLTLDFCRGLCYNEAVSCIAK